MTVDSRTASLTRTMINGSLWLFSASGILAVASFACNWALGMWLSEGDFGIYALAISCATLVQVFRDGGVQYWLARQTPETYQRSRSAAFWLTMMASMAVAAILIGLSGMIGHVYQSDDVSRLVVLLGLATPIQSLAIVSDAGMQVSLRFRELSALRVIAGVVRYVTTIVLAAWGFGPYSFVWPLYLVGLVQAWLSFSWTGTRPWEYAFRLRDTIAVVLQSKWAMAGTFATAVLQQIDYVTLGLVARGPTGKAVVGTYFFAFLFAMQPATLLGQSLRKVFVPAFAATSHDHTRRKRGAEHAIALIGLVVSPLIILFALLAEEFVTLLWGQKWVAAIPAIQLLALAVPIHFLVDVTRMITQADGRFRLWTAAVLLRGVSMALAVLLAGLLGGAENPTIVAACVAGVIALGGLVESYVLLYRANLPTTRFITLFLIAYLTGCVCGIIVWQGFPSVGRLWWTAIGKTACYVVLLCVALATFFRPHVAEIVAMGRRLVSGSTNRSAAFHSTATKGTGAP